MNTQLDVLVVGDANPDLVLRGDVVPRFGQVEQMLSAADLVLGGSAAITASGCARLGLRTALLARVGDDVFGGVTRAWLEERGVVLENPRPAAGEPTGLSVILSGPDDRSILTLPGTIPTLTPSDISDELLARTRHLHVASVFLQPALADGLADVFARARALGVTTSLDTNWDPSERWTGIRELLGGVDVFLPNTAELLAVTGAADVAAAAALLVASGTTVVLKDGARGGRAWTPAASAEAETANSAGGFSASGGAGGLSASGGAGEFSAPGGAGGYSVPGGAGGYSVPGGAGEFSAVSGIAEFSAPSLAVDVVDTTGAGDSFNAGFLAARLGGSDLPEAVAWAAAAGSLSTRAPGGTAAQATRAEIRAALTPA
ncbi:carbohydrate kinase family protein [Cryptosporangium arvum]|uniref:carbohydrate kinase family protein n=1 Tax=Cryptosporangium arvum TaxID=80871 RepID=UPI0004B6F9BB|nr:carbohydrate kinase family protein [Cryptosporangium arvum]